MGALVAFGIAGLIIWASSRDRRKCAECGTSIRPHHRFCHQCGAAKGNVPHPAVTRFITRAGERSIISGRTAKKLHVFHHGPGAADPAGPALDPGLAGRVDELIEDLDRPEPSPRAPTQTPPPRPQRPSSPPKSAPPGLGRPPAPPRSQPSPAARPARARPVRTGPSFGERLRSALRTAGKRLTAEVAAYGLTYLGVLLAGLVIFIFFAYGYFGDVIRIKATRPLFLVAVPIAFFGFSWVLRTRTGIPESGTAVGVIGALTVPIVLSGLFRDGSLCCPPDVNGPARWLAYGFAILLTAAVYYLLARREHLYAYLVGPAFWSAVGAVGLFLEDGIGLARQHGLGIFSAGFDAFTTDGISGPQMVAVLVTMGLTVLAVTALRGTRFGSVVSAPTVWAGAAAAPFVAVILAVFAYQDAVVGGIVSPDLGDVAATLSAGSAALALFAFAMSRAGFAVEGLAPRVRSQFRAVAITLGHIGVAFAWLVPALGAWPLHWVGVGLTAHALLIGLRRAPAPGNVLVARVTGLCGLALALIGPGSASAAWGAALALVVGRGAFPAVRRVSAGLMPRFQSAAAPIAELWLVGTAFLAAGPVRLGWPGGSSWVLAGAAVVAVVTRILPSSQATLRSVARGPAVTLVAASLATELVVWSEGLRPDTVALGSLMVALAAIALFLEFPYAARVVPATALGLVGVFALLEGLVDAGRIEPSATTQVLLDMGPATLVGACFVVASLLTRRHAEINASIGHLLLYVGFGLGAVDRLVALVALAAIVVTHLAEAWAVERGRAWAIEAAAVRSGRLADTVRAAPAIVAGLAAPFAAGLAGREIPWLVEERPRAAVALGLAAWVYAGAGRLQRHRRPAFRFLAVAGHLLAAAGVVASIPSVPALLVTMGSAAVFTFAFALWRGRPYSTVVSWALVAGVIVLAASHQGVASSDLHFVHFAVAAGGLVAIPSAVSLLGRRRRLASAWLQAPVALGLLLMPVSLAYAIGDGRLLGVLTVSAAACYGLLGWAARTGGVALPAVLMLGIAYAHSLEAHLSTFDNPVLWIPFAFLLAVVAQLLPERRSWRFLDHAAPGLVAGAAGAIGLALAIAAGTGDTGLVLMASAPVPLLVALWQRSAAWLYAAIVPWVLGGIFSGLGWAAVTAMSAGFVLGTLGTVFITRRVAAAEIFAATGLLAAGYSFGGHWLGLTTTQWAWANVITAALLVAVATAAAITGTLPARALVWVVPVGILGQAAAGSAAMLAVAGFGPRDAASVLLVLALAEGAAAGALGTVRSSAALIAGSVALAGGAFGAAGTWAGWNSATWVWATAAAAAVVIAASGAVLVAAVRRRLRLWAIPLAVLGQVGAMASVATAFGYFERHEALGVTAILLVLEAVMVAALATLFRVEGLVVLSGTLLIGSAAAVGGWLRLTPLEWMWATGIVGAGLVAAAAAGVLLWRQGLPAMWARTAGFLGQFVVLLTGVQGAYRLELSDTYWTFLVVAAAEAIALGLIATVWRFPWLAAASTVFTGLGFASLIGAMGWDAREALVFVAMVTICLALFATVLGYLAQGRIRVWVLPAHGLTVAGGVAVVSLAAGIPTVELARVVGDVAAGAAVYAAANAVAVPRLPMFEAAAVLAVTAVAAYAIDVVPQPEGWVWLHGGAAAGTAAAALGAVLRQIRVVRPLWILGGGLAATSVAVAYAGYAPAPDHAVVTIFLAGADLVLIGLASRLLPLVQAGIAVWTVSALVVGDHTAWGPHSVALPVAIGVLLVLEVQRQRDDWSPEMASALRPVEWLLILIPPALAAADMFRDLAFGVLLAGEGALLFAYGLIGRMRRRVFVGFAALAASPVLMLAIPLARAGADFTQGELLVVGAVAAALFIFLGSTMERQRRRLQRVAGRISEFMEEWE